MSTLGSYKRDLDLAFHEWQPDARCIGATKEFYPDSLFKQRETALTYCRGCPVRLQCLEYALVLEEPGTPSHTRDGVWGGFADLDRKFLASILRSKYPVWEPQILRGALAGEMEHFDLNPPRRGRKPKGAEMIEGA